MENISKQQIKEVIDKLDQPITLPNLAKALNLESTNQISKLERYLKQSRNELNINLIEVPTSSNTENDLEYVLEYRCGDERNSYEQMNDEELLKTYHELIFKVNKLKDQKAKLENSEVKGKFIKSLHKYNELKDIGQAVLGKLAELQNKTVNELYEDYDLDLND